tara:strand:+ start:20087 stop:20233 length:147 start_codon:yes stop_codon:yes gene_type:complete
MIPPFFCFGVSIKNKEKTGLHILESIMISEALNNAKTLRIFHFLGGII